jgi:Na+/melibiose symporter-like transporter
VISGINFICLALPIALCAASVLLLLLYNLSDKRMEEIRRILAEKHEN